MQDFTILSFSSHSVDNLKAFVQQYLDGELEIYVKSEPIPEDNSGPVKVCMYTYNIFIECFVYKMSHMSLLQKWLFLQPVCICQLWKII